MSIAVCASTAVDFLAPANLDPVRLRRLRKSHRHAIGIGDAVVGAIGGRRARRWFEPGAESPRLVGREPLDVDAVRALKRDVLPEGIDAVLGGEQEQIPVRPEVDRVADDVLEVGKERDRFFGERDVGRVRELVAKAAGIAPRGASAELGLAFDDDDIGDAALRRDDTRRSRPCSRLR